MSEAMKENWSTQWPKYTFFMHSKQYNAKPVIKPE